MKNATLLPTKLLKNALTFLVVLTIGIIPVVTRAQFAYSPASGIAYHSKAQYSVAPTGSTGPFSLVGAPAGITINATTGQISWDATVAVGHYNLTVTDGTNTASYALNVIPDPNSYFTVKYSASAATTVQYGASTKYNNVDVYLPSGDTNTQRPVLMFLHGGGFQSTGTKTESYVVSFCKYFATLGFVCFAPNYNEGAGHTAAQNLAALKDADSCLNWIRNPATAAKYKYDPEMLYFGGGSSGAHLSCNFAFADGNSWYNGFTPNIKNVIAFADCWGSSPVMSSSGAGDRLYNFSSLNANSLPAYMVQGSADQTVPVSNGIQLDAALTAVGATHDWWEIPGETHGCPGHIPQISDSMKTFFQKIWKIKYPQTINAVVTPVKLSSFDAALVGNKVTIAWTTATELNTSHFEVERGIDGKNFAKSGVINAVGNATLAQHYTYSDNVSALTGTVYYRLKSVDRNGSFSYSSVKAVELKLTKSSVTNVYPNPLRAGQDLMVTYNSLKGDKATFQISNSIGQKVVNSTLPVNAGSNTLSLAVGHLSAGVYYLTVLENNQSVQRMPLVIK